MLAVSHSGAVLPISGRVEAVRPVVAVGVGRDADDDPVVGHQSLALLWAGNGFETGVSKQVCDRGIELIGIAVRDCRCGAIQGRTERRNRTVRRSAAGTKHWSYECEEKRYHRRPIAPPRAHGAPCVSSIAAICCACLPRIKTGTCRRPRSILIVLCTEPEGRTPRSFYATVPSPLP
jgi:hypothetical protein